MRILPYIIGGKQNTDLSAADILLCEKALLLAEQSTDRLQENYKIDRLHLEDMIMFNFVFEGTTPVLMSGCQTVNENTIRVQSRYFAFERTDGTDLLEKIDDFLELEYCLDRISHYPLIIWTRDKSKGFFNRLKKGRSDIFNEWYIHPEKIPVIYPNNEQYVFYKGDINYMLN